VKPFRHSASRSSVNTGNVGVELRLRKRSTVVGLAFEDGANVAWVKIETSSIEAFLESFSYILHSLVRLIEPRVDG
jgi:hypothetical protein